MSESCMLIGRAIVVSSAVGELLHADLGLSFWGGVNPTSGEVIDRHHPLSGTSLAGKVLAIPNGRGSCTGSQVILELLLNGNGPAAILLRQPDEIISLGVIIAEEFFGQSLPVVSLGPDGFAELASAAQNGSVSARVAGASVHLRATNATGTSAPSEAPALLEDIDAPAASFDAEVSLAPSDRAILDGQSGRAAQAAMRIVVRMAAVQGAAELINVSQVHIDGCTYIGPAGLRFAQQLVQWGGKVCVPTTLNAISVDKSNWRRLGVPTALGEPAEALADAYLAIGAKPSFTCAPYLLGSAPGRGEQVGWGESNAVVFANSVLGARTQKYADYLDACIALTGRAPSAGCHLDSERVARVVLALPPLDVAQIDDAFYPTLGYLCGLKAEADIPAIVGLENLVPNRDDLKAFSAAFGTSSSAAMFHMVGITPEAPDLASALGHRSVDEVKMVKLSHEDLECAWQELDSSTNSTVELVSLGNPHFSAEEHARLAELCRGRVKHPSVNLVVTTGPEILAAARSAGHATELEQFGVHFISDTCWCMLGEVVPAPLSVLPSTVLTLITNSAKYAHYAPGLTGRQVRFATLAGCVDAACSGQAPNIQPGWLSRRGFHTQVRHFSHAPNLGMQVSWRFRSNSIRAVRAVLRVVF